MKIGRVQRDTPLEGADASGPRCPTPSSIATSPTTLSSPLSATSDTSSLMSLESEDSSQPPKEYPSAPPKASSLPRQRAQQPVTHHDETADGLSTIQSSPPMPPNVERFRSWPRSDHSCKGYVPRPRRALRDIINDGLGIFAEDALDPHLGEGVASLASSEHARQTTPPMLLTNKARPESMAELAAKCTHTLQALLQRAAEEKASLEAKNAELSAQLEEVRAKEAKRGLEQEEELRVLRLRLKESVRNYQVECKRHRSTREKAEDAIYALQMALDDEFYSDDASDTTPNEEGFADDEEDEEQEDAEDLARQAWAQATLKQEAQRRILDTNAVAAARGVWLDILAHARITTMLSDFSLSAFSLEVPLIPNSVPWPVLTNPLELTLEEVTAESVKAFCVNMERWSSEGVCRDRLLGMWQLFRVEEDEEAWEGALESVMDESVREGIRDAVGVVCEALGAVVREHGWDEEEREERWDEDEDIFVGDEQEEIDVNEVASELEGGDDDDETY